jgi:hypothetical protein
MSACYSNRNPEIFTFAKTPAGIVNIRDFQTTGVVAFARGCPFLGGL